MRNTDMGTLPPCRKCLIQHLRRVNYQVSIWKSSHIAEPVIPVASEGHGWTRVNGGVEPLWIEDVLPRRLVDIVQDTVDADSDEENESDIELDNIAD